VLSWAFPAWRSIPEQYKSGGGRLLNLRNSGGDPHRFAVEMR